MNFQFFLMSYLFQLRPLLKYQNLYKNFLLCVFLHEFLHIVNKVVINNFCFYKNLLLVNFYDIHIIFQGKNYDFFLVFFEI